MKRKKKSKSNNQQRWMSRAYAAGNWFMIPRPFVRKMPMMGAIILAFLIDASYKFQMSPLTHTPDDLPKSDGWFMCEMQRVLDELGISESTYLRNLKWFKDHKVLYVERRGYDNRRYMWINWDLINELIDQWEQQ